MKALTQLLAVTLGLFLAEIAQATLITVNWSGTVTQTGIAGTVDIGDTITGIFNYDDTALADITAPTYQQYATAHDSSFTVNGLSGTKPGNSIAVFNDYSGSIFDQFDSRGINNSYTGDLLGGGIVTQIFVRWSDESATALSDTSLPSTLDPSDFDFLRDSRLDGPDVHFFVDTFTFEGGSVPAPTTVALFGLGLAGLGWSRRKKV